MTLIEHERKTAISIGGGKGDSRRSRMPIEKKPVTRETGKKAQEEGMFFEGVQNPVSKKASAVSRKKGTSPGGLGEMCRLGVRASKGRKQKTNPREEPSQHFLVPTKVFRYRREREFPSKGFSVFFGFSKKKKTEALRSSRDPMCTRGRLRPATGQAGKRGPPSWTKNEKPDDKTESRGKCQERNRQGGDPEGPMMCLQKSGRGGPTKKVLTKKTKPGF